MSVVYICRPAPGGPPVPGSGVGTVKAILAAAGTGGHNGPGPAAGAGLPAHNENDPGRCYNPTNINVNLCQT